MRCMPSGLETMSDIDPAANRAEQLARRVTAAAPRLVIDGVDVRAKAIAELREGVTLPQAIWVTENDRLDEVFFEAAGKRYVAYGQGLKLPAGTTGDPKSYKALFGKVPATILHVDNQVNTAGEGALEALKLAGVYTVVRLGIVGLGIGASRVSESMAGVIGKVKGVAREGLEVIARKTGTKVPVAGAVVVGTLYVGEIALGALIGANRTPDEARVREITN